VQRFILQQNIERFRARLSEACDAATRERIKAMLAAFERDLALFNSAQTGVRDRPSNGAAERRNAQVRAAMLEAFRRDYGASPKLAALIDPEPGLVIAEVNTTYLQSSGRSREQVVGQPLFLAFPDNPDDPTADGVSHLYASLRAVAETGRTHAMADQRYDVRDGDGHFVERYWRPVNSPLHDEVGRLVFLLHVVEEVTEEVVGARAPA
jgi:PAS domain-containing protein